MKNDNRVVYLDYVRVLATFAVINIHVIAVNWHKEDVTGLSWNVMNVYDTF